MDHNAMRVLTDEECQAVGGGEPMPTVSLLVIIGEAIYHALNTASKYYATADVG